MSRSTDYNFIFTADTLIPKSAKVAVTFPDDVNLPKENACVDLFVKDNELVTCTVDPTDRVVMLRPAADESVASDDADVHVN